MTFSEQLFSHLDVARDGVEAVSAELCGSESFPQILPEWFSLLWDVIRATTPVLQRAVGRLPLHAEHRVAPGRQDAGRMGGMQARRGPAAGKDVADPQEDLA